MVDKKEQAARDIILDSIADGVFTVDREWTITSFNRAAETITGITRVEAIGQRCCDVFRTSICETECALNQTLQSGKSLINKEIYILNAEGRQVPVSISTALLEDENGQIIGGVETFRDLSEIEGLRKELEGRYVFADIFSRNHKMQQLFDIIPEVAGSTSAVLIEGESGTGKELVARAIHNLGPRKSGPFVAVNCGALPETLLESELFGYCAGAFTDAKKDKPGRLALAEGGTLFLDEIGDISPAMQVRLLRVLQTKTYEPLGASASVTADVRIVSATNHDLERLIEERTFRRDLYYRINVVRLFLPPLRERKEDIPLLVENFIARFNRLLNRSVTGVTQDVMGVLVAHDYPGNIRELENIIEHAFVLCSRGVIDRRHLPEKLAGTQEAGPDARGSVTSLREMERIFIMDALRRHEGNRLAAARELGIHKSTLFRKITSLQIDIPPKNSPSDT
ncbi:MAG TPA: sigma 54-interacting transcriptional regulator [Acidobacteriota bacterium]|nr:sigma 54-interacting transcriptional regulator [Acidobacteriota bacterium]